MPDLTIKPNAGSGNKVIIQDQAGAAVLTTADSGATLSNSTQDNITRLGTVAAGTIGSAVNLNSATFPAGHILQVKHFPYTSNMSIPANGRGNAVSIPFTGSASNNSYGCPITMSDTNNKVGVFLTISSGNVNEGINHQYELMYNTSVGGTWVQSDVNGGANYWALVEHNTYTGIIYQNLYHNVNDIFVPSSYDSGTTVWVKNQTWMNGSGTSYINRSGNGSNYVKGTSMILMEIKV